MNGAVSKGYSRETASEVYGYIERFADYGFNRSHAVAYSKVAYQLAYVKANYPASFYTAVMRSSGKEKVKTFVAEAKQQGVPFLGPNINQSFQSFIIENNRIRFGFEVIMGLPRNFIYEIIEERKRNGKYTGLVQFLSRINLKWLNESYIQPLIYSGAFDGFHQNRASLLESLNGVIESIEMSQGNTELFDIFSPTVVQRDELADEDKMKQEFEATGFYFTAEPGEKYKHLRKDSKMTYLENGKKHENVTVLVVVDKITRIQTKKGEPMSFVDVIDNSGKGTLTLFPNIHRRYIQMLNEGDTIVVKGKVEEKQPNVKIIANHMVRADDVIERKENQQQSRKLSKQILYIRFKSLQAEKNKLNALQILLKQHHGSIPVVIYDDATKTQKPFKKEYHILVNEELMKKLMKMFGKENILLKERKSNA